MEAKHKKYNYKEVLTAGIFKENPIFKLLLSLCPALGVTAVLVNSVGLGVIILVSLIMTNTIIAIVGKFVPDEIRIPAYITIIAGVITIMEMMVHAFMPDLFAALGVFLSLVVVNCIIMGRAEAFAAKNTVLASIYDAIGNGLGIIFALAVIAFFREFFGRGFVDFGFFRLNVFPQEYAIGFLVQPMGAFLMLGIIVGIMSTIAVGKNNQKKAALKSQKTATTKAKG
ncbi:MAG: electron transport complex subunit RsxE [Defluviitaleaceae bacterium]|nr:electron transport complex subunit RsxE [Defluviitaleaceae bacterium]